MWKIFWDDIKKSEKIGSANFLSKFLTEEERTIFEKRLAAMHFLKQGESLRETARKADVAKKTVIFIKRGLKPLKYKKKVYSSSKIKISKKKNFKERPWPSVYTHGRRSLRK